MGGKRRKKEKNCFDFYQRIYASHGKSREGDKQIPEEVHTETQWRGGRRGGGEVSLNVCAAEGHFHGRVQP